MNIRLYTTKANNIPECLGYPLDLIKDLTEEVMDLCIEKERQAMLSASSMNKALFISEAIEYIAKELEDYSDDRNFQFLADMIVNDVLYRFELTLVWMNVPENERQILAQHFGWAFGYYAHKKQIMMMGLDNDKEE